MKKQIVMAMVAMFFVATVFFLNGQNCHAADKLATLKKIEGAWTAKHETQSGGMAKKPIEFMVENDTLVVKLMRKGVSPEETRIPLSEVSDTGNDLVFGINFPPFVKKANIKVTPDGKVNGEAVRRGHKVDFVPISFER
jgi:hypothetical protein